MTTNLTSIKDLHEAVLALLLLIKGLIKEAVVLNALQEVLHGVLLLHVGVVWVGHFALLRVSKIMAIVLIL